MTPEQFIKVLRGFLKRKYFHPFTLELVSGSRIEVNHPEALWLEKELIVCRSTSGVQSVFAYESVVRFIDATGIS